MIDDATAAYILENQRCFEDLKQVASQLAGASYTFVTALVTGIFVLGHMQIPL